MSQKFVVVTFHYVGIPRYVRVQKCSSIQMVCSDLDQFQLIAHSLI
jgi:hypothetical protein